MALDRFIEWGERRPTSEELERVARNFLGGVGTVTWSRNRSRLYLELPGVCTHPLTGIAGTPALPPVAGERWIEVHHVEGGPTDVITRQHDAFTNALAQRLQDVLASWWGGQKDPHGT